MGNLTFVRVPKCASSTLNTLLQWGYNEKYGQCHNRYLGAHLRYEDHKHITEDKISLVRDPVERTISHYYWCKQLALFEKRAGEKIMSLKFTHIGADITIPEFAELNNNYFVEWLGTDLTPYKFIGLQERFIETVSKVFKMYDVPLKPDWEQMRKSATKNKPIVAPDIRDYIRSLNAEDYELYEEIKNKYWLTNLE
jgi:hypothetical protein